MIKSYNQTTESFIKFATIIIVMETTNEFKNISVKIDTFQILYKMKGREGNITWDDVIKYLIRRERENESKSQSEKHAKLLQEFRGAAIQK